MYEILAFFLSIYSKQREFKNNREGHIDSAPVDKCLLWLHKAFDVTLDFNYRRPYTKFMTLIHEYREGPGIFKVTTIIVRCVHLSII